MDVGYFGAAHALIYPAHDIAKNALRVIFQLVTNFGGRPVATTRQRNGEQLLQRSDAFRLALRLLGEDVDLMIMDGMQGRGSRRGHPGGIGSGPGMAYLLRSEEHTSELQSLMRISYAVFCLKKQTNYKTQKFIKITLDTQAP